MSASIYIAQFPLNNGFEYRVANLLHIEETEYNRSIPDNIVDAHIVCCFSSAISFNTLEAAQLHAVDMKSKYSIVEYGIYQIQFSKPILDISVEEAANIIEKYWEEFYEKRDTLPAVKNIVPKNMSLDEPFDDQVNTQVEKYGRIAYHVYQSFMTSEIYTSWENLSIYTKQAWISVSMEVQKAVLKDLK